MSPEKLCKLSIRLHNKGLTPLARLIKTMNYLTFRAILPYECEIGENLRLFHRGLGVVIHPRTVIGDNVKIGHNVTISGGWQDEGSTLGVTVRDNAYIGSGAMIIPRAGKALEIGEGSTVGGNATVISDLPAGATAVSSTARIIKSSNEP